MKRLILLFSCFCLGVSAQQTFNGFALYSLQDKSYLVDKDGLVAHTWNCNVNENYAVLLKDNGNIVRGGKYSNNQLNGAAVGGMVQEIDANGNVVWEFVYSDANYVSHHDITLIGDNVLLTAWEVKTANEVNALGGNTNSDKWPTHFVEVAQDGTGGKIVWEWHIWDHLCQDVDPSKPNYVSNISDHPELIDVNMIQSSGGGGSGGGSGDWFHVNGVDYNPELDQIAFSSRFASEIYIIDHSTTTTEAASHSGGNSGMGGDILYRWGNPSNYNQSGQQVIPDAVHDVRWIKNDGRPNGGYLQIFNNKGGGSNPVQSTIDAINPPLDPNGYTYQKTAGVAYAPATYDWRYSCVYSAPGQSASDRMSNGNTFINASGGQGGAGIMYEVDSLGNLVWSYNPSGGDPKKAFRYECDHPGIIALLNNPCNISLDASNISNENIVFSPNPSQGKFNILGLYDNQIQIIIYDSMGVKKFEEKNIDNFDISYLPNGIYYVKIIMPEGEELTHLLSLIR